MLKEYQYAVDVSNKASLSAKSRYANAEPTHIEGNATITNTNTITKTKYIYLDQFKEFWNKLSYKVSKGQVYENYKQLDKEWALQPKELADAYNDYYNSIPEKKYAKQPAFWLSAEKYLDEKPKEYSKKEEDNYKLQSYVDMYRKGIRLPIWSKQDLDKLEALAKQTN
jgi:hypothetical protein